MTSHRHSLSSPLGVAKARLILMTVCAGGALTLVVATMVHETDPAARSGPAAWRSGEAAAPEAARAASVLTAAVVTEVPSPTSSQVCVVVPRTREAPTRVNELFAREANVTPEELAAWTADEKLDAQVRYCALRRLEQADSRRAVGAALEVLDDPTPLLRLNAIALLTRASDPRATEALERLDPRSRMLALALNRRRS